MKLKRKIAAVFLAALVAAGIVLGGCASGSSTTSSQSVTKAGTTDASGETLAANAKVTLGTAQSPEAVAKQNAQWTILVYLCGTDLESNYGSGTLNLSEICEAVDSDKVNVVIETGGTKEWQTEGIQNNQLTRFAKQGNELIPVGSATQARMSLESTYADFVSWGVKTFPAQKYMLIVWDHGGGSASGVVQDELYSESDPCLSVKEIAEGVQQSGANFEVVGFDACLMATVDQASALSDCAKYMIASEETEPSTGWDYTSFLNYLQENPECTGAQLGSQIVDTFYDKCAKAQQESACTLSVTDLTKVPAVVDAYNAMAQEMSTALEDTTKLRTITGAFKSAESYGGNNDSSGYSDMIDLGDFVTEAKSVLTGSADQVQSALSQAVVYHKNGSARSKGAGLSMYVPLDRSATVFQTYAQNASFSNPYLQFIRTLYGFGTGTTGTTTSSSSSEDSDIDDSEALESDSEERAAAALKSKKTKIQQTTTINKDGYIEVQVTQGADLIDAARCNVYWYNTDEKLYYYLGSDYTVTINDDWTKFEDNFDNQWVYINDHLCMLLIKNRDDQTISYDVPVQVNGKNTNLELVYRFDTQKFEVTGLWDGVTSNGLASRTYSQLKNGDKIDFRFYAKSNLQDAGKEVVFEGFTYNGNLSVADQDMGDGVYAYSMTLEDIFGEMTETDWATITVENGQVSCELGNINS